MALLGSLAREALYLLALLGRHAEALSPGCLKLDNYTLDRMLALPGYSYLLKLDSPYSYGEKEDAFQSLCKLAYHVPKFFVSFVPVQEFNEKDNDDVRERFGLKKEDFPVHYLFTRGKTEGIRYTGKVQANDMIMWLRTNEINMPSLDTVDELDTLARAFVKDPKPSLRAEAEAVAAKYSTDPKAPMYLKIMDKLQEKGEGYALEEIKRVTKLLHSSMSTEKKAELTEKLKVLKVFGGVDTCDAYQCPAGYKRKFDAEGILGSDTATCCKEPCEDTSGDGKDLQGHDCTYYESSRTRLECGDYDDPDFSSSKMCCACGGGRGVPMPSGMKM